MNPLQNKSQGDAQKNLAHAEAKQANAKTEPENAKIIIATHHTHSEEATEFAQSGQKSGLFAKLPAQLRTCGQIVNDLIFRFRVKQCPNKELRKLSADAKQIRRSPLFDRLWYCSHYKKQIRPTQNAIYHYLRISRSLSRCRCSQSESVVALSSHRQARKTCSKCTELRRGIK